MKTHTPLELLKLLQAINPETQSMCMNDKRDWFSFSKLLLTVAYSDWDYEYVIMVDIEIDLGIKIDYSGDWKDSLTTNPDYLTHGITPEMPRDYGKQIQVMVTNHKGSYWSKPVRLIGITQLGKYMVESLNPTAVPITSSYDEARIAKEGE